LASQEVTVSQWDGRGLPPVAADRVARANSSGVHTSLLSVAAATSLQSVGLDAVGEVMGCIVEQIGWQGYVGCGAYVGFGGSFGLAPPTAIGSRQSRWAAFRPYADAVRHGYATALSRLFLEAAALGADGVVGIRLNLSNLDGAREFMALGTAVRARSNVRPARPFTTNLSGNDVAKLIQAGWVPASLIVGFDMAIRHDDWQTRVEAGSWSNVEVSGYTELTQHVRSIVREDVRQQVRQLGADGFVASTIDMRVFEVEPAENHRDHVAEAVIIGTALAQFRSTTAGAGRSRRDRVADRPHALSVLPLADLPTRRTHR
jgi:uncharacterized protein YbjQ (UPF0145 family)